METQRAGQRVSSRPSAYPQVDRLAERVSRLLHGRIGAAAIESSSPDVGWEHRLERVEARIDLAAPLDGRKRFRGRLLGRAEEHVRLIGEAGEVRLPLAAIVRAKLVMTEDLLAAARPKSAPAH